MHMHHQLNFYLAPVSFAWSSYHVALVESPIGTHVRFILQHTFDVVRSAGQSTYNYVDPPQRDVVSIGTPDDNVTIRFLTDNNGPWMLHW